MCQDLHLRWSDTKALLIPLHHTPSLRESVTKCIITELHSGKEFLFFVYGTALTCLDLPRLYSVALNSKTISMFSYRILLHWLLIAMNWSSATAASPNPQTAIKHLVFRKQCVWRSESFYLPGDIEMPFHLYLQEIILTLKNQSHEKFFLGRLTWVGWVCSGRCPVRTRHSV